MKSEQVELWLKGHGVTKFDYEENIALGAIDEEASLRNQARVFEALDDEQIVLYAQAMTEGDEFPPIVVIKRPRTPKYIIIDGNHRMQAAKLADKKGLSAYVVKDASPAQVMVLTYDANTKHGKPTSLKERIVQAAWLVQNQGAKPSEAAKALSVPPQRLYSHIKSAETTTRARALGLKLPDTYINKRLGNLGPDAVFKAAAELVTQAKLDHKAINNLVTAANRYRNEKDQLAAVARFAKEYEGVVKATAGGTISLPRDIQRLQRAVSSIRSVPVAAVRRALHTNNGELSDEAKKAVATQVSGALKHLNQMLTLLGLKETKE